MCYFKMTACIRVDFTSHVVCITYPEILIQNTRTTTDNVGERGTLSAQIKVLGCHSLSNNTDSKAFLINLNCTTYHIGIFTL